ncbi:MAG: hypothetical protein PHZ02_15375, partial [Desulfocapsaceae bacterium]|nr:hypothetical protein [Desulfocapsaceae bacterium]
MMRHRNHHELARQVVEGAVALLIGKGQFKGLDLGVFNGDFSDHCRLGEIVFCTLGLHGCLVVSFFPGLFPLIFAGHADEANDINAAEADTDAAAAADTTGATVLGNVVVQLVHETLADGAGPRVHRIVATSHAGEAPESAGIPTAQPHSGLLVASAVADGETGAGGADIGTTGTVLTAQGELLPHLLRHQAGLEATNGLIGMNVEPKLGHGLQRALILLPDILLLGRGEELDP